MLGWHGVLVYFASVEAPSAKCLDKTRIGDDLLHHPLESGV
jgi:hypothetical protein